MIVENTVIPVQNTTLDKTKADIFFASFPREKVVSYKEYWESVRPQNTEDIFRRYLFAYCSVHTTWKGNCAGYNAIKNNAEYEEIMLSCVMIKHKDHLVRVGSGFTIEQRKEFYQNPNKILGKTVTVQYFEETKNQDGGISLRFPTFKILHGYSRTI